MERAGRSNMTRSMGEVESRLRGNPIVDATHSGTVKMDQVMQSASPRGYITDINSYIFDSPISGSYSLDDTEYPSSKKQLEVDRVLNDELQSLVDWAETEAEFNDTDFKQQVVNTINAQTFVFGDTPSYSYDIAGFTGQLQLPYDQCTFVLPKFTGGCFIALVEKVRDNQLLISGLYRNRGSTAKWTACAMKHRVHFTAGQIKVFQVGLGADVISRKTRTTMGRNLDKAVRAILAFIDGLDKKTVLAVKPTLVPSTHGTTATDDSVRVVYMKGHIPQANAPLGGTHASPREHSRCAHWATRGGRKVWVSATVVNKGKGKRIDKEYRIMSGATATGR